MKAIFLKEFRENMKWAALAMLAMGGFLEWAIRESSAPEVLSDMFFFATISGFSAIALALGLLQIFQDQWRGREAFIVHRPIHRSTAFLGKIVAGLLLYFIAAGVPLTIAIFWCRAHGYRTAPFEWRMVWPGIWDLVNGTVVYFAALLLGSREAKWFGSRLMPLAVPFLATSAGCMFALDIGEALVITSIALLIIIPAAWSSFVHHGSFEAQPLFVRAIQTAIMTLGAIVCFWTVSYFALDSLKWINSYKYSGWNYAVDDNGHLLRREFDGYGFTRTTDLAGNVVAAPPETHQAYLFWPRSIEDLPFLTRHGNSFHRRERYLREIRFDGGQFRNEILTYSVERKVIEEFDEIRGHWIGTVGRDGFVPAPQTAVPFERPLSHDVDGYIDDGKTAYRAGIEGNHVKTLMTVSGDDQIGSLAPFGDLTNAHPYYPYLAILTSKSLWIYKDDNELFNISLPFGPPVYSYFWIKPISNGHFSIFFESGQTQYATEPMHLIELDERGEIVKQTNAPPWPLANYPWWSNILPILPSPLGIFALASIIPQAPPPPLSAVIAIAGIAIICAWAAVWWTKRYSLPRAPRATWIVFSTLMGVPGLLGLIAIRSWPARIKCPSCGKLRIVTRESCEHCSASFSPPQALGIEIFE